MSSSSFNLASGLSGPTSIPAKATHLLVCLHGFGDEGQSYLNFAPILNAIFAESPSPANHKIILGLACPNGPQPCSRTGGYGAAYESGYQWFKDMSWKFNDAPGHAEAARKLDAYLTSLSQTYAIPRSHIALLGFSQGAMVLLHALPGLSEAPPCAIALSGGLTVPPAIPQAAPRIPLLFIHGLADDVWPADTTVNAETLYRNHGYPTELHLLEDLAHGINAEALAHTATFLAAHLPA